METTRKRKGIENLIPLNKRPKGFASEIGKKGAAATNEKLRKRKALRETIDLYLKRPIPKKSQANDAAKMAAEIFGVPASKLTMQDLLIVGALRGALKKAAEGDWGAFAILRDTLGENPVLMHQIDLTSVDGSMSPVPAVIGLADLSEDTLKRLENSSYKRINKRRKNDAE